VVRTIPPDHSFADPDLIDNPSFRFWYDDGNAPISWDLQTTGNVTTSMALETVSGREALVVKVGAALGGAMTGKLANVRLVQSITFPTELTAWAYPTVTSTNLLQSPYGLAFDDGEHRLWVLFGASDTHVKLDENFGYVYFPAPTKAWSRHIIHLQELYDLFDWQLPEPSIRRRNGLEYRTRQVQLSLVFPVETQSAFGPIAQEIDVDKTEAFWSETLSHPERYYIQHGNEYRRQRNYDLAQDAYRQAITYDPTNAESYFGLAEASFWREDWSAAIDAFEKSVEYSCQRPAQAYRGIGWSRYNREEFTQAKQAFEEATEIDPNLADAHNGLGWIAVRERRCDDAVVHFERVLALEPNFSDPRRGLDACEQSLEED
jgi:Tfp pilus assembly protein PilF